MSVSEENFDLGNKSLSLIDFGSEDDCLYISPSRDRQILQISDDHTKQENVQLLGTQSPGDFIEGNEQVKPCESSDQKKTKNNEKYNLRKSLAWDSAFFTSAGFLEPDELSSMLSGAETGGKGFALPGIEEEINRSTDSISTLATENSTLGTLEDDLFGDIRASIQKSSKASSVIGRAEKVEEKLTLLGIEEDISRSTDSISTLATEDSRLGTLEDDLFGDIRASIQKSNKASKASISRMKVGSGVNESQHIKSSEKLNIVSQNKLKTKAGIKKPNVAMKGSAIMVHQVAPNPEASKFGSRNGESTSSLGKPPKIVARVCPIPPAAAKRASLSANHIKVEKDSEKVLGRGAKVPAIVGSQKAVPKPLLPVKSSLRSSVATKTQLTPASSTESLESLSSSNSSKCSLDIMKRNFDSKAGKYSSVGSTVKSTTSNTSGNRNQSMSSRISAHLKSVKKPSSSISPASSSSELSLKSSSPASTLNRRSNISRPSLDSSSCKKISDNVDASPELDSEKHSNDNCSVGHSTQVTGLLNESAERVSTGSGALVHSNASKPSGLRMPSPKLGFFDGARSNVRTPTGSMKSHPTAPCDLPKFGAGNVSPIWVSKQTRFGKFQPTRTIMAVRATKTGVQKAASEIKPKSPLPLQEPSNVSPKFRTGTGEHCLGVPLKVQNKMSPGNVEQCNLKDENIAPEECNTLSNPKHRMSRQGAEVITTMSGGSSTACNSSATSEVGNILSQEVWANEICGQKNGLSSPNDIKNEKACVEHQVDSVA